ncbi:hypothetical protein M409DRAFT_53689 [Zasmidium cellare ATCC 36951]|uniref:MAPEG family protein n=1 Tax=Zasmidium cellare ATCC 36951 TaxID=1080233 RepID=A0A6A6CPA9_ZASCE|nr:uncharacterized protein M409DRAFT_53689 [Zasmidium cellare ATCC 36951]KAF2167712.1 hypothetical protein M409DRAFT_53689 [Zasmidium cellare ATCC 36951]
MLPREHSKSLYKKATNKDFDNRHPRAFLTAVENDQALDSATRARILRAEAACYNGFENFGPFCAALAAGNAARLDPIWLNGLSLAYLASRAVYTYVYINNETQLLAGLRGGSYIGGLVMLFTMFIKAGNKLSTSVL